MTLKLNSLRLLNQHKIHYQVHQFADTIHDATEVAEFVNKPPHLVYKTLVVLSAKPRVKPMLIMIAAERQLDLKQVAKSIGEKKVQMASHREAEDLTGLKVGGISALALLNKGFQIYIEAAAQDLDTILVSAGQRGVNVEVAVKDLVKLTKAKWVVNE